MASAAERAEKRKKLESTLKADQEAMIKRRQEREAKRAALLAEEAEARKELNRLKEKVSDACMPNRPSC